MFDQIHRRSSFSVRRVALLTCIAFLVMKQYVPGVEHRFKGFKDFSYAHSLTSYSDAYFSAIYSGFKDISDPREHKTDAIEKGLSSSDNNVPLFWHIPKTGGSTLKAVLRACHKLAVATDAGVRGGHDQDKEIALVNIDGKSFVNVDVSTPKGIERAKRLGLAQSSLAKLVVTSEIYAIASIFDKSHSGIVFAMFRHPIDRAISLCNYLAYATWEATYQFQKGEMTLEACRKILGEQNNWMVRMITNQQAEGSKVTRKHLEIAKDFIRQKVLVGLTSEMEESLERFEIYFKLKYTVNPEWQENCRIMRMTYGRVNVNKEKKVEKPEPGSMSYELLAWQYGLDIELYEYTEALFKEQKKWFIDYPSTYRTVDAKCCECDGTCPK